jgi:hypothetical protein
MAKKSLSGLWIGATICLIVFVTLFAVRLGLFSRFSHGNASAILAGQSLPDRDTWMKILQKDQKIGYSHSVFKNMTDHYSLEETLALQVTIMGMTHHVRLNLDAVLNKDLALRSFESRMQSGPFEFSASGRVMDKTLIVKTETEGESREVRLPVQETPYLPAGLVYAVCDSGMAPGDAMSVSIFDPSSMAVVPVRITVGEKEFIKVMNLNQAATRLEIDFKGMTQQVWISEHGEILKESGLMGLSSEKTDKHDALARIDGSAGDLTELLAIPSNVIFDDPQRLDMLKVGLEGVDPDRLELTGGRQSLSGKVLTIIKEKWPASGKPTEAPGDLTPFLQPDTFIQSDNPAIKDLAIRIAPPESADTEKAEKLMRWVYENIDKKPVVSMPNALSTLTHRQGDCNEHAMLLAALARAAGIPAQVETGLVYLRGKFFYHAWNRFYVAGGWITADAAFGQMPADVTHIRLAGGAPEQQLDLVPVIGRIGLRIMDYAPRP